MDTIVYEAGRATLENDALEQTFTEGGDKVICCTYCTCTLTKYGNIFRIAAKVCNVLLYPF